MDVVADEVRKAIAILSGVFGQSPQNGTPVRLQHGYFCKDANMICPHQGDEGHIVGPIRERWWSVTFDHTDNCGNGQRTCWFHDTQLHSVSGAPLGDQSKEG